MDHKPWIIVVGGINVDIIGTAATNMLHGDSNPGTVRVSMGGVGRNIAENLIRLGARVSMVSVLGDDPQAANVRRHSEGIGLDLSLSETLPGLSTSTYLCVNDADGDLYAAVADMGICERITPEFLSARLETLNRADLIVADANIPAESMTYLAEHCQKPVMVDPVSVKKAGKTAQALPRLFALKPNRQEAALLSGVPIVGMDGIEEAASVLLATGLDRVYISLGSQGVFYADRSQSGRIPCAPATIRNTNGCGDTFFAATAIGYLLGMALADTARFGQAAAAICAESTEAVSPELTLSAALARAENLDWKEAE